MSEKCYIIISEGITDCSLLEVIIEKFLCFEPYDNVKKLPEIFKQMIGQYPALSGELKRQDSPTFFYKDNVCVAIKQANGYSNIPQRVSALTEIIEKEDFYEQFGGFLIFCDTDLKSRKDTIDTFTKAFAENEILYESDSLEVYHHTVLCKMHLFPKNGNGAVEKLLLECAKATYSFLCDDANDFRNRIMDEKYSNIRKKCWAKNEDIQEFYADKVQFGVVSSVIKPDRPVRFAIKDKIFHKQYLEQYEKLPEFKALLEFLESNLI